jgi:hypothetical protein
MMFNAWMAVVVIWTIGATVFTLLCSEPSRWVFTAKLGLSFGLGLVTLTLTLFVVSLFGLKPAPWLGLCELTVLLAFTFIAKRRQLFGWLIKTESTDQIVLGPAVRTMEVMLAVFVIGIFIVMSGVALAEPIVEWDVMGIWALKAKVLFYEPVLRTGYFQDLTKAYSHLDYPLAWPMAMAWIWSWIGSTDLVGVKVLAPAFFASILLTFFGLLRRKHSRPMSMLFTALLAGLPMLSSQIARLMSDPPLSFFWLGAVVCAYFWLESKHTDDLVIAAMFIVGILFTKNEGIGLWLVLVVSIATAILMRRETAFWSTAAVCIVLAPMVATFTWFVFRVGISKAHEDYGGKLNPIYFLNHISRVPEVLSGFLGAFCSWTDWLLLWPLVLLSLAAGPTQLLRSPVTFLLLTVTLPLLMYGYIYVVTPWDLKELLEVTANRLLLHIAPLSVFLAAEQLRTCRLLPSALSLTVQP